jgi:MFS family permease
MTNMESASAVEEWKRSWTLVLACVGGIALSSISVYSMGAFVLPIEKEFGWSRTQITAGLTIGMGLGACLAPFVGVVIDWLGPRRVAVPGTILFACSIALLSLATSTHTWWALWIFVGLCGLLIKPTVWTASISSMFDKSRGLALAVALCGTSVASGLSGLIATYYIGAFGWRTAYVLLSATFAIVVVPLIFFFFRGAADHGRSAASRTRLASENMPGLTLEQGFRTLAFYKIAIAALAITAAAVSMSLMMIPILTSMDFSAGSAARIAALIGVASVIGRIMTGSLLDRFSGRVVGGISCMMPVFTCCLFLAFPGSTPAAIAAVLILGLCLGSELDATAYLASRYVGLKRFGTFYGIVASAMGISTALGPLMLNIIYDADKSYVLAFWVLIPIAAIASTMLFTLPPYPKFENDPEEVFA